MKPCTRKAMFSSSLLQAIGFGQKNTVASVKGSVKKLGVNYQEATVALYSKTNLLPILAIKPKIDGSYQFFGLNNSINCFIVAFDNKKQYNAVIQDGVVPK